MADTKDIERRDPMCDTLYVGSPRQGTSGSDRVKRRQQAGTLEPDPVQTKVCRSLSSEVTPDLHTLCPVCGKAYQAGDGVLALTCLAYGPGAARSLVAAAGGDGSRNIVLGHHECVLPRLLTLLADFQPAARFVRAFRGSCAGEPLSPKAAP
jgi:hypothetical protein